MIYTAAFKEHDSECFLENTTQIFKCLRRKKKKRKENSGKQTNTQTKTQGYINIEDRSKIRYLLFRLALLGQFQLQERS